jgi:hypothetical protein
MAGSCFTKGPTTRIPSGPAGLKIPETSGFVVKSTKTTDDFEARRFAEDLYYRLEGKARRGEPINSPTFRKVFTEWARVPVAEQVVRTLRYVNGNVRRVEIWALTDVDGEEPQTIRPQRTTISERSDRR